VKVYCCFPFLNEFDVLDVHLEELRGVVDTFVLVEGTKTHTGHPKPLYFNERKEQYKGYPIVHRVVELDGGPTPREPWFNWGREIQQRSAINGVLAELAAADDIVISCDVDEIAHTSAVADYLLLDDSDSICSIEMITFHYNLNTRLVALNTDAKICRYRDVERIGVADLRYYDQKFHPPVIKGGGWHLSFMGGTDKIIEKMKAYAHYDERDPNQQAYLTRENVEASVRERKSVFMRDDIKYVRDENPPLPRLVARDRKRFIELGWFA
jgi:beta-1,4-mannosyl-glycoprotein beta-1,4-N-acetylglucosaminyltransferase